MPTMENSKLVEQLMPVPAEGDALIKALYLAVDSLYARKDDRSKILCSALRIK